MNGVPVDGPRAYDDLVAAGVIQQSEANRRRRPDSRIVADGTVSDLVGDQRR